MTNPPISVGQIHTVKISSVGEKGDGIARINNFIVIIPDAGKGETLKIKIEKVSTKVAFGKILEKVEKQTKKYVTVTKSSIYSNKPKKQVSHYEDTEDFGED